MRFFFLSLYLGGRERADGGVCVASTRVSGKSKKDATGGTLSITVCSVHFYLNSGGV